jgi:hypothetical protein
LVERLKAAGYEARHVAQEHSYVPDMWQRLTKPDVLIYLDLSYDSMQQRRSVWWGPEWLDEEHHRLRHAREHCDLYLHTDQLTADEVAAQVIEFLAGLP